MFLEISLPDRNVEESAKILAPFLLISNHMVFNFEDADFKESLITTIDVLMKTTKYFNYNSLVQN